MHVPSVRQLTDVFMKGLPLVLFFEFRDSLTIMDVDVETVEGVSKTKPPTRSSACSTESSVLIRLAIAHRAPIACLGL
jgi:hypothetical protein